MPNLNQQSILILGQTLEFGSPVFLVSIDGEHPEPMSQNVLEELVQPPQCLNWQWDNVTRSNTMPVIETVERGMFRFLDEPGARRRSVKVR